MNDIAIITDLNRTKNTEEQTEMMKRRMILWQQLNLKQ